MKKKGKKKKKLMCVGKLHFDEMQQIFFKKHIIKILQNIRPSIKCYGQKKELA